MSAPSEDTIQGTAGSLASVVPQLFYDVIARIIPGAFLFGLYVVVMLGPMEALATVKKLQSVDLDATTVLLLLLVGSVLSYALSVLLWRQLPLPRTLREYKGVKYEKTPEIKSFMYDYIKHKDPVAGSRITKLTAEIHMTQVLSAGFIYAFLLTCLMYLLPFLGIPTTSDPTRWLLLPVSALGLLGSYLSRGYFCARSKLALENCYEIHDGPEKRRDGTPMFPGEPSRSDPGYGS